ncbi:ATPase, T2SS/T4P/T4SS family [Vulcanisaeta souniana]|uniref:ATPase, T2SS/T4P/T4SS family n=1 Tax=Vulcanisaeta souniana TaxID=164452 RepID=UPI00166409F0|nr:ATPase, T2SS/T4P/T4SS family [Vulcanisaeta souniana]
MHTAFDFKVNNPGVPALNSLGTIVTPSGVTTEILYIEQPEGARFYLHDVLNYPEYMECLDMPRIIEWLSSGLTWGRLEKNPRLILKALPRVPKGVDLSLLTSEAIAIARRFIMEYSVITPLLAWDELQDLVIDAPGVDGEPMVFARVRGFGDAYHPVVIMPNKCQLENEGRKPRLLTSDVGGGEPVTFNAYIINKASERTRTPVTAFNPRGMATDGELRLRVTMHAEPVSGYVVAFRKHPSKPWHLGRLIAGGSINVETAGKLLLASLGVKPYSRDGEPRGVLVYGPMGSGKTTLTSAIMNTYPPWVRVVAVQDVDEFRVLPDRTYAVLNTRASTGLGARAITKAELIADAMRTGAQFVFVNEILSPGDARAWVRAVTSGHGGVSNLHAGSLEELIDRLERLGIRGASHLVSEFIIAVRMENKRVVEVHTPARADFTRPLPSVFSGFLSELSSNPDDYSLIRRMWAEARCVIDTGSIECLSEGVSIKSM